MIPEWPHPDTSTRPSAVLITSEASSGTVSSTVPVGVVTVPRMLQLRSVKGRGTGPVNQTPGMSSTGPSCSMKVPPVAS